MTVLFPCPKESQTPKLPSSASDLSGLGPSGRFQPRAPNLASKVFISEKLKPKLHLHNKKTPMLGASAAGRGEDMQSRLSLAKQRQ